MRLTAIAPLALLLFSICPSLSAQGLAASSELETRVTLQKALEHRLQTVLRKMLDTEDVLVIVNAEVLSEEEKAEEEVLPGVPVKETPAAWGMPHNTRTLVRSLSVTVLVDEAIDDTDKALVDKTARDVLSLDEKRGDILKITPMRLTRKIVETKSLYQKFLEPSLFLSILWLIFIFVMLILVYGRFLRPLLSVLRTWAMMKAQPAAAAAPFPQQAQDAGSSQAELPQTVIKAIDGRGGFEAESGEEMPFDFIQERHAPMLKYLLQRAQPRTAAVIIHYLPPALAGQMLSVLSPEARQEVAIHMSKVVQLDEDNVAEIEDSLRARLDYLMGGEDKLASILDEVPSTLQDELIKAVRSKDPETGDRISRRIVRLETLALLSPTDLKNLSRRVPIKSLAAVLKASEELKARILPKLTAGLGQWLSQEISLSGDLPPARLEEEQRKVLSMLSQMVREGRIVLSEQEEPSSAEPAAVEAPAKAEALPAPGAPDMEVPGSSEKPD